MPDFFCPCSIKTFELFYRDYNAQTNGFVLQTNGFDFFEKSMNAIWQKPMQIINTQTKVYQTFFHNMHTLWSLHKYLEVGELEIGYVTVI